MSANIRSVGTSFAVLCLGAMLYAQAQPAPTWKEPSGNHIRAQKLVDDLLKAHPDVVVCAMHVTKPGTNDNTIIAANIPRIGKPSDEDDWGVIKTGKPLLEPNKDKTRFEVILPLLDKPGKTIGAVAIVANYKEGEDTAKFLTNATQLRDGLRNQIPSAAWLYQPEK